MPGRCLLLVALLVAPLLTAAVPDLDLAKWNRAYKYEALHVPATLLKPASALYDGGSADAYVEPLFPLVGYDVQRQCKGPDAKVDPTQAKAGTCQYKVNKDGTYTYWEKQPGDWSRLTNCYCYALDVFKGTWCQPGAGGGVSLEQHSMTCAVLEKAVIADGAKKITRQQAMNSQPPKGQYVAMFLRPQSSCNFARCEPDFHFLRKDSNGLWSQKAGEAAATNRDLTGGLIKDPQTAKLQGSYTDFCGYYHMDPSTMKIGTTSVPNMVSRGLDKWKAKGLQVSVQPLAYNAEVDASDPTKDYAMLQQQMFAIQRGQPSQSGRKLLLQLQAGSR